MAQLLLAGVIGAAASLALAYRWRHRLADRYTPPAVAAAIPDPAGLIIDNDPAGFVAAVKGELDRAIAASEWKDELALDLADQEFGTCGWSFATEDTAGVPFDNGRIPTTCPGCGNYVDLIPDAHRQGELHIVEHPVLWDQDADR